MRLEGSDRKKVFGEALEAARQIEDEWSRSDVLIAVAERLEDSDRELLREVLEAARQITSRSDALVAVAVRLEGSDRELLRETLEAARQIKDEWSRSDVLIAWPNGWKAVTGSCYGRRWRPPARSKMRGGALTLWSR